MWRATAVVILVLAMLRINSISSIAKAKAIIKEHISFYRVSGKSDEKIYRQMQHNDVLKPAKKQAKRAYERYNREQEQFLCQRIC